MQTMSINILVENSWNVTTANISDLHDYIKTAIPTAKLNWAPNNIFMFPWNKNDENALINTYLQAGDELSYWYWFPAVDYNTLTAFQAQLNESDSSSTTRYGKTPTSFCSWHLPADYINELVTNRWIKVATWTVWSQTNVDRFQWEWSRLFPYMPSTTNSFVPGKTPATTQDLVLLNSLSPDPLGCRVLTGDSRWTLHPADPDPSSSASQKHIIDQALLNQNYHLNVYIEVEWLYSSSLITRFKELIDYIATKDISIITLEEYNTYYRDRFTNESVHTMEYTWSGISFGTSSSDSNIKQLWYEDIDGVVCLAKDLTTEEITVEACLTYFEDYPENYWEFLFEWEHYKDWSYKNWMSYKFDNPVVAWTRYNNRVNEKLLNKAMTLLT